MSDSNQLVCLTQTSLYSHRSRLEEEDCLCENKDADQLCSNSNCTADRRLCFRYSDSTIPLLLKSKIPSVNMVLEVEPWIKFVQPLDYVRSDKSPLSTTTTIVDNYFVQSYQQSNRVTLPHLSTQYMVLHESTK